MLDRLRTIVLITCLMVAHGSCAGSPVRTQWEAERNRKALPQLVIGMTTDQVSLIMGPPYKTESYQRGENRLEFWFYLTEALSVHQPLSDSNFTPLAFQDGSLQGWGRNYYDTVLRVTQEIKVKND